MTPKQLRMAIAAEGLTLAELAKESGVSAETTSKIQTGKSSPRTSTMAKLKAVFTSRGYTFSQTNGHVCVCAPADE